MKVQVIDNGIQHEWLNPAIAGDAGLDLRACIESPIELWGGMQMTIGTGIKVAIPENMVGLIYPRSGLGVNGLVLGNLTGVIDSSYRGEVKVCLWNRNKEGYKTIHPYDKIAQLVVVPVFTFDYFEIVDSLDCTARGDKGFGSTGK